MLRAAKSGLVLQLRFLLVASVSKARQSQCDATVRNNCGQVNAKGLPLTCRGLEGQVNLHSHSNTAVASQRAKLVGHPGSRQLWQLEAVAALAAGCVSCMYNIFALICASTVIATLLEAPRR